MPRKFKSTERFLKPDPRFRSKLISKFINTMMYKGKKTTAQKTIYDAFELIKKKMGEKTDPVVVFTQALENVKPRIEVSLDTRGSESAKRNAHGQAHGRGTDGRLQA